LVARDIRQVKAFYNVDKRRPCSAKPPDYASGVWAVLGAPEEQSTFGEKEAVLKISLFASVVASAQVRDGFDYVDLSYFHEDRPDLPRSYGGISGSGLWRLPISRAEGAAIEWSGELHGEGVAFYQKPVGAVEGVIRCHGRMSVFERAVEEALKGPKPNATEAPSGMLDSGADTTAWATDRPGADITDWRELQMRPPSHG
jgi:hypothetical protein